MQAYKEQITNILNAAVTAPSGDNYQHWSFIVDNLKIRVMQVDQKIIFGPSAFYLGMGALIENIIIAADHYGFRAKTTYFPDPSNPLHTADVDLYPDNTDRGVDLFRFFHKRHTDRFPYQTEKLPSYAISALTELNNLPNNHRVVCISDPMLIRKLGNTVSKQAIILFSHHDLNHQFNETIRWNAKSTDGLPSATLGLTYFELIFFKYILSRWSFLRFLRFLGVPYIAAELESIRHTKAGAYFAYIAPKSSVNPTVEVISGQLFEQFWLRATKLGLCVQPTGALMLLQDAVKSKNFKANKYQNQIINDANMDISNLVGAKSDEAVMWIMRVGLSSNNTSKKSSRREPTIIFQ